jgi:signal transduction histidine kinase
MTVNRLIAACAVAFGVFFALINWQVMSRIIDSGFRQLETQQSLQTSKRVVRFFSEQVEQLRSKTHDWTIWDEMYEYASGRSPQFADSNITFDALEALQIQSLVLVDHNQRIIAAYRVDPEAKSLRKVPELFDILRDRVGVFGANDLSAEHSGLYIIQEKSMLVVARSVMRSDVSGPAAGTLYFCVDVDSDLIEKAKHAIGVNISILEGAKSDQLIAANKGKQTSDYFQFSADDNLALLVTLNAEIAQVFLNIMSLSREPQPEKVLTSQSPQLRLKIEYPRDIMQLGARVQTYVLVMVLILGVSGWLIFFFIVRVFVINRLTAIEKMISEHEISDRELVEKLRQNYLDGSRNEIDKLGSAFVRVLDRTISAEALRDKVRADMMHSAKLASLGEMAGGIAHEINNPLTVISGRSRQLRLLLEKQALTQDKATTLIQSIEVTAERIARIVKSLRTHSRSSEDDELLQVDVKSIIDGTFELCQDQLKEKLIKSTVTIDPPGLSIQCREVQIGQVLLNLIKNAIDAIESLTAEDDRWIRVAVTKDLSGAVKIAVTNGGPVIPEKVWSRLFQPFFTTKPIGKGTGLGLSISAGILRQHQGSLTLDTKCEHTQFVLEFPPSMTQGLVREEGAS